MSESEQQVCLITGGSSGIGEATVRKFCDHGYRIATCARNLEKLATVTAAILTRTNQHLVEAVDLAVPVQAADFAERILAKFGRIDVLVNNAASAPLAPLHEISDEDFEQTTNVNIRSNFYLTRTVWRQMRKQNHGTVIGVSSLAAIDPFPGFSIYGASKAWLELMVKALAAEGREHNIDVFAIRAGAVETPLLRRLFPDFPAEQCVSAEQVASQIWDCVENSDHYESGSAIEVANQQ